ncbi:hypothetical protein ASD04_05350 [Devosia sp. Root436]|jgi:C4-dicarboxylate transporter DctQ subunit|uniref:TRAP transporter small permease n=1 Tax=Devosia sp. Root436 TaxID=1736537 RepID=UPI0006FF6C86|nr:TRAP transporter small permease [Devosia sp. Root436]KQX40070.1 hypothetical protein ASD04_05350 [Devosia sp. Root436]
MAAFLRFLRSLEHTLLASVMLIMVLMYSGSIAVRELVPSYARYVVWVDEATRYMMVWLVFLALGIALERGRQIAMTSYLEMMPPRVQFALRKIIDLTGLLFSLYITWVGVEMTMVIAGTGQRSPTLGISTAYLYLALPAGFALLALRYGLSLAGIIDRWSNSTHEGAV